MILANNIGCVLELAVPDRADLELNSVAGCPTAETAHGYAQVKRGVRTS